VSGVSADPGSASNAVGGDSSNVGGGGRASGLSLSQRGTTGGAFAGPSAPSGDVNSGKKNVDYKSVGNLGDIMKILESLGISEDDLEALAKKYGVPKKMILAVIKQESGGNPKAQSGAGAQGLMQLMPETAKGLGVDNPFDPKQNLEGGIKLLAQNLQRYNGDTKLALAAYNAGPGNVDKYGGVPPFAETQTYVKNITAMMGE
jgi:soluble lytic murein transglycosylase-like protein